MSLVGPLPDSFNMITFSIQKKFINLYSTYNNTQWELSNHYYQEFF